MCSRLFHAYILRFVVTLHLQENDDDVSVINYAAVILHI